MGAIVSTAPYTLSSLLYSVVMLYVLAVCVGVFAGAYYVYTGERPWWHAGVLGAGLLVFVFIVQLLPIRIGAIMFLNGMLTTVVGYFASKIGYRWWRYGGIGGG